MDFFDFSAIFSGFGRRSRKPRYLNVHLFKCSFKFCSLGLNLYCLLTLNYLHLEETLKKEKHIALFEEDLKHMECAVEKVRI